MEERWIKNGIRGRGDLPPMAGNWSGPAIILGCGRCLYAEAARYVDIADIIAINYTGILCPYNKRHLVSLHPEEILHLKELLRFNNRWQIDHLFTHSTTGAEVNWDFDDPEIGNGTSALFATLIAVVLGYNPVILAGVPLDNTGNFYHPPEYMINYWENGSSHDKWLEYRPLLLNRVFSLSGFTREILGEPPGCKSAIITSSLTN